MAKSKKFSVTVDPEDVVYTSISKSKDGYNSARIVVKTGDKEYMIISYEWEEGTPGFVLSLMDFMKASNMETSGVWPEKEEEYATYKEQRSE
jgi:hypothetical protein